LTIRTAGSVGAVSTDRHRWPDSAGAAVLPRRPTRSAGPSIHRTPADQRLKPRLVNRSQRGTRHRSDGAQSDQGVLEGMGLRLSIRGPCRIAARVRWPPRATPTTLLRSERVEITRTFTRSPDCDRAGELTPGFRPSSLAVWPGPALSAFAVMPKGHDISPESHDGREGRTREESAIFATFMQPSKVGRTLTLQPSNVATAPRVQSSRLFVQTSKESVCCGICERP
jgi:hypothetical protein